MARSKTPWYAGKHQDALLYLLIAIFFIELIVGGVAFFHGIIHAEPEVAGGPPLARFPWLGWALAAVLAPVGLLLIVHLAGTWVNAAIDREEQPAGEAKELPPALQNFYAAIRHAPTVVILLAILLLGAALFFVDGAMAALGRFCELLVPYLPWILGSIAVLLAVLFIAHAVLVYRQRKLDHEYAWRREVLERTGMIITDKTSTALPAGPIQAGLPAGQVAIGEAGDIVDVTPGQLPSAPDSPGDKSDPDRQEG